MEDKGLWGGRFLIDSTDVTSCFGLTECEPEIVGVRYWVPLLILMEDLLPGGRPSCHSEAEIFSVSHYSLYSDGLDFGAEDLVIECCFGEVFPGCCTEYAANGDRAIEDSEGDRATRGLP